MADRPNHANSTGRERQSIDANPSRDAETTFLMPQTQEKQDVDKHVKSECGDTKPRPQPVDQSRKTFSVSIDGFGCLLCVAIMVFAILVYRADGNVAGSYEEQLVEIAGIGVTAFPYIFSLFLGRTVQNLLDWRLGRGIRVLSFSYMSRSTSLASAVMAPVLLKAIHWMPVVLIPIWVLSPLGSRALKQFVVIEQRALPSLVPMSYYYPGERLAVPGASVIEKISAGTVALLKTTMFSVASSALETQDAYGNLKIPILMATSADREGWIDVTSSTQVSYSSLLGIPFQRAAISGNASFTFQSWYWTLSDPSTTNYSIKAAANSSVDMPGFYNITSDSGYWRMFLPESMQDVMVSTSPRSYPFIFDGRVINHDSFSIYSNYTRLSAQLTQQPIDVRATCSLSSCSASSVRAGSFPKDYLLSNDYRYFANDMADELSYAFIRSRAQDGLINFLNYPSINPFNASSMWMGSGSSYLSHMDATALAQRLEQIFNTYWLTPAVLGSIGGFSSLNNSALSGFWQLHTTNATLYTETPILVVNKSWLTMLFISTLVLLGATICSVVFVVLYDGPHATDFISALVRSWNVPRLSHGTYMEGDELAREMSGMSFRIGEIPGVDNEPARIVIGPSDEVEGMMKGKKYA